MKFRILLFLLFINYSFANAQINNGMKAQDFTFTALNNNGQVVNLYSWLDSGKYVFIDVSATWCGYCWAYHQTHALKDLYNQYGPGTAANKVRVVFVESSPNTLDASMSGGPGSMGDWLAGTPYPMVNPSAAQAEIFNANYEIVGYPTIFMVCPDRTIKYASQGNAASLYAQVSPTPNCPAKINTDIATKGYDGKLISCNGNFSLNVALKNRGFNNITSANLVAKNGTTTVANSTWTGTIVNNQTINANFNLNGVSAYDSLNIEVLTTGDQIAGNHNFKIYLDHYTPTNASALPYTNSLNTETKLPYKFGYETLNSTKLFFFYDGINSSTKVTGADGNFTKAIYIDYLTPDAGTKGILTLGNFKTTNYNSLTFEFDYASAAFASTPTTDSLEVVVSNDCGLTWVSKWLKFGTNLHTTNPKNGKFYPTTASHWVHVSADISEIANNPNALVGIRATCVSGNNTWLDNLKITGTIGTVGIKELDKNSIEIYPNPANNFVTINGLTGTATVAVVDVLGRTVLTKNLDNINGAAQLNVSKLENGNYILKIESKGHVISKKFKKK